MLKYTLVRLLVFFVVLAAVDAACQLAPLYLHLPWLLPKSGVFLIGSAVGLALAMIIAYRLLVRWVEARAADELGRAGAGWYAISGAIIGTAMFASVYALLAFKGIVQIGAHGGADGLAAAIAVAIASAVGEEIIFRGALFRILEDGFGSLVALLVSAAVFGALHGFNPGASLVSDAAIALEAGVLLAAAFAATRSLWFPIGLHFGWNLTEGGVFGSAVSGGKAHGLVTSTFVSGNPLWSGGAFGPEASIAAVGVSLLVSIAFLAVVVARGHWQPVRVRMRTADAETISRI